MFPGDGDQQTCAIPPGNGGTPTRGVDASMATGLADEATGAALGVPPAGGCAALGKSASHQDAPGGGGDGSAGDANDRDGSASDANGSGGSAGDGGGCGGTGCTGGGSGNGERGACGDDGRPPAPPGTGCDIGKRG